MGIFFGNKGRDDNTWTIILHSHIHLIPRRAGDAENPRGGVRVVIPEKQNY